MNNNIFFYDIILHIYKQYFKHNTICKKYKNMFNITLVSTQFFNIYNSHFKFNLKCNLITYPITICQYHDNISQQYIDSLLYEIKKYNKLQHNLVLKDQHFFNIQNINNFIHCENLKKNEKISTLILQKFNLKINKYCCNGNGCSLINIT